MANKKRQVMMCPECGGEIELYDTNPSGTGGKYRCKECPRDTVWAVGKAMSFMDVINEMKARAPAHCKSCGKNRDGVAQEAIAKRLAKREERAKAKTVTKEELAQMDDPTPNEQPWE